MVDCREHLEVPVLKQTRVYKLLFVEKVGIRVSKFFFVKVGIRKVVIRVSKFFFFVVSVQTQGYKPLFADKVKTGGYKLLFVPKVQRGVSKVIVAEQEPIHVAKI